MPQNQRESLLYTVMMCFVMVLWMSVYNVALQYGTLNLEVLEKGWIGFPFAYIFGMCCDWFVASKIAKGVAFGYLLKPAGSSPEENPLHFRRNGGVHGDPDVLLRSL